VQLFTHRFGGVLAVAAVMLIAAGCATSTDASTVSPGDVPITAAPAPLPSITEPPVPVTTSEPPATHGPSETPGPLPLAGRVIVIDPGHNGRNAQHLEETTKLVDIGNGTKPCNSTGTASAGGFSEAELNWQVALRTREALAALGANVVLTRLDNDGWGPCITERAAVGNRVEADAAVSIHADGGPADGRGFHVIHPAFVPGLTDDIAAPSLQLARSLRASMAETAMPVADYIAVDGFSERSDLGGLNLSDIPAVFLEMGNMKNAEDAALLADAGFQQEVAAAIARALSTFLER